MTSIGNSAFYACNHLTSIQIPDGVTNIGSRMFYYCYALSSITIGSGVTSISDDVFLNCNMLKTLTIKATTPPTLGGSRSLPSNVTNIYLPAGSVDAYKAASGWSSYADKISAIAA